MEQGFHLFLGSFAEAQAIAALLDHLMGSNGAPGGRWLSDGSGVTPELEKVGEKVREYAALGYLEDVAEVSDAREYFAAALAMYLRSPRELNAADPHIHGLLRRTILSEPFWPRISPDLSRAD